MPDDDSSTDERSVTRRSSRNLGGAPYYLPTIDTSSLVGIQALQAQLRAAAAPNVATLVPGLAALQANIVEAALPKFDMATLLPGLAAMQANLKNLFVPTFDVATIMPSFAAMQESLRQASRIDTSGLTTAIGQLSSTIAATVPRFDFEATVAPAFAQLASTLTELDRQASEAWAGLDFDEIVTRVGELDIDELSDSLAFLEDDAEIADGAESATLKPVMVAALVCAFTLISTGRFVEYLLEHSDNADQATFLMWVFAMMTGVVVPSTKGAYKIAKKRQDRGAVPDAD